MHLFWPGPQHVGSVTQPEIEPKFSLNTQSPTTGYQVALGPAFFIHSAASSSVTLGKIFSFTEWFYTIIEMVLKISSLLDKWELKEKYVPKCLEISPGEVVKRLGESLPLRKHEKKKEKYVSHQRELFQGPPSIRIDSKWQLNHYGHSCIIYAFIQQMWISHGSNESLEGPSKGIICFRAGSESCCPKFCSWLCEEVWGLPW